MPAEVGEFLERHRDALIAKWEAKVRAALQDDERFTGEQLRNSLHLFLDEIIDRLLAFSRGGAQAGRRRSPIAREHGGQRQVLQLGIIELVREYSLLHESIAELADETVTTLSGRGITALTTQLFSGAAEAVEEYVRRQEEEQHRGNFEYFAFVAHELRNPLSSAQLAWESTLRKSALDPRLSEVINRSLKRLKEQIDHSITQSRLTSFRGRPEIRRERVSLDLLVVDACADSTIDAEAKGIRLDRPASDLFVEGDFRLLRSALSNLIRNAIKFTRAGGTVSIRGRPEGDRVLIEVADECGGLPVERAERLFQSFSQIGRDRSGFGLGLAISKQAVEAHGGTLHVKNVPAQGCIFTIDLPGEGTIADRPEPRPARSEEHGRV